jgi:DNA replication initiation complex subunit (GINS family)
VNSRLKKIVALSSGPPQTEQTLKKFTSEEKLIYEQLSKIINEWKAQIIDLEGENRAE